MSKIRPSGKMPEALVTASWPCSSNPWSSTTSLKPQPQNLSACSRKFRLSSRNLSCSCICCGVRKVPLVQSTGCSCFIRNDRALTIVIHTKRRKGCFRASVQRHEPFPPRLGSCLRNGGIHAIELARGEDSAAGIWRASDGSGLRHRKLKPLWDRAHGLAGRLLCPRCCLGGLLLSSAGRLRHLPGSLLRLLLCLLRRGLGLLCCLLGLLLRLLCSLLSLLSGLLRLLRRLLTLLRGSLSLLLRLLCGSLSLLLRLLRGSLCLLLGLLRSGLS